MKLETIEIIEDRTAHSRCDEGFLVVARLVVRNHYDDGSISDPYPCDVVSRPGSDAVVAVLYEVDSERRITVVLRENARPPIYLRRFKQFERPDPREYRSILEVVAGLVEGGDGAGDAGLARTASREAEEEAGYSIARGAFQPLGGETFASPGTSDEKVFFCSAPVAAADAREPSGDGTVMEEVGTPVLRELGDAIDACRRGEIPDMKTEIALLRLADQLGYVAQLGCFADELPPELRSRYRRLGVEGREP
jgi:ADP-ribose pyrophosphatase